ncbi:hypothetical protein FPV67DRAFT_392745 [Lyophyllum atratum]|nr:hypothetical protein FPV67DRAFT_392745 [Lyophyllum atratum]
MITTGIDVANLLETLDQDRQHSQKIELHRNLQALQSAEYSAWDAEQACLPTTRTVLIQEIMELIKSNDRSSQICLLTGVAGSGKSTIAHSVAKACFEEKVLASSFFFKTGQKYRDSPIRLISTFARDLATTDKQLGEEISSTVQENAAIATSHSISTQFTKLIQDPLKQFPPSGTLVFVIDALDEGYNNELVILLSKRIPELPANVRFFITSRPNAEPTQQLLRSAHVSRTILDIHDKANESDLLTYVQHRLRDIATFADLDDDWPGLSLTNELASRAGGLFQWARTTCDYIRQSAYPDKKLVDLMSNAVGVWTGPEQQMDGIYSTILQGYLWTDNDFVEGYHAVVGAVIASKTSLSVSALQSLQFANPSLRVKRIVKLLGSLLHDVGDEKKPLEPLHLSLREFLTSSNRVKSNYFIDMQANNSRLALHCLQLLNKELPAQDIPDLGYLTTVGVADGMPIIPREHVSEAVWYACRFWADHMKDIYAQSISPGYVPALREFLTQHLVTWLEIVTGVERYQELFVVKKWLLDNKETITDDKILAAIFSRPLATCLKNISRRLSDSSRHEEALLAATEAVELYRHFVSKVDENQRPPPGHVMRLASGLRRLSQCFSAVGRRKEALDCMDEGVRLQRSVKTDTFSPPTHDFAQALRNLSNCFADLGRMEEALKVIEEAVEVAASASWGEPNTKEVNTHAACLHSYANHLYTVGRREDALISICRAVHIRRGILQQSDNLSCLEELATSLQNLAVQLGEDTKAAVEVSKEAVNMRRVLSGGPRAAAYTPRADLARGLNNFSNHLDRLEESKMAMDAIEEAVSIGRGLVIENPVPFDPDLAVCLSNYSNCLSNEGRHQEALDVMLEAMEIHRKLANRYPEIYEDNLATALRTLGRCYAAIRGRQDMAAASLRESKEVYERVASRSPHGQAAGLAVDDDKIDIVHSTRHPRNRKRSVPSPLAPAMTL